MTNPCIEFWQLLHVSDVVSEYSEVLDDILENKLDEKGNSFVSNLLYEKTGQRKAIQLKTFEKYYLPNIDLAIERAKGFAPGD
ncbi:RloB domain-containing protein [Dorea formicigenerans]|uniref:RloB domain-containing protein n=1 Tax=Dorea formicigenerans TaxID=39486 RepID=UPI003B5116E7